MNLHMPIAAPGSPLLANAIARLAARLAGTIVLPDQHDFDAMRALAHSNWDKTPLFVARVANAPDVADVVDFARRYDLELAVRSGGHSVCGHSASQDGVVIDLRDLQDIDIDLETMTVWAGGGLTAGQLSRALDQHGVAVGFGDSGRVGIGGLTLGGGLGYLTRKFGLTADALVAAEIVTTQGILVVDETHRPELFWAIRGGGGNFGVVTRFCYRLNPLPEFTGGPLVLPATPETLAGFVAAAEAAPDELSTILMVMPAPPMPFIPPEMIGQTILLGMMAYAGPNAAAQEALAPFRTLATPVADLVQPGPYSMMYPPEQDGVTPAVSVRTMFRQEFGIEEATRVLDAIAWGEAPMRVAQIRVLGGAAARVPADATAYAHRDARMLIGFLAMDGNAGAAAHHDRWAERSVASLGGAGQGTYVNFLAEEGPDMLQRTYPPATWNKLRQVKRRYDPDNVFHLNHNIPPA
jgi:FAD/FMN-containing dehydrogenase